MTTGPYANAHYGSSKIESSATPDSIIMSNENMHDKGVRSRSDETLILNQRAQPSSSPVRTVSRSSPVLVFARECFHPRRNRVPMRPQKLDSTFSHGIISESGVSEPNFLITK